MNKIIFPILLLSTLSIAEPLNFDGIVEEAGQDWKKELISLCRSSKEEVEANPDDRLIHSGIVSSHFENAMGMISKSEQFSEKVKAILEKSFKAKDDFDKGLCPDFVVGINKMRFKRFKQGKTEEFVIALPDDFQPTKPVAVFVHPDNRRWAAKNNKYSSRSSFIDIWWHTVDNKVINWKNFDVFMAIVSQKVKIDFDRIYVNGECDNGLASISLALRRPDYWAECSASLGNTYRYMAGNAYNLPLIFVRGEHKEERLVGYYDFAVDCLEFYNCRFFKHSKPLSTATLRGSAVPDEIRVKKPLRVIYTIDNYENPKAYWCKVDGRVDENLPATIDVVIWGQKVLIKTENIDAYTIDFLNAPIDVNRPVEIVENDQSLGEFAGNEFVKRADKYKNAKFVKNHNLQGPINDIFTDPYVIVISSQDVNEVKICQTVAKSIFNSDEVVSDVNLTDDIIENQNLVVIGTAKNNKYLQKIIDQLPVDIDANSLTADEIKLNNTDAGVIIIHPNPLNLFRYVMVLAGTTQKGLEKIGNAYNQIKNNLLADVAVYDLAENGFIKFHIMEKLDTTWQFHPNRREVLAELKESYPKWKWQQFLAKAVREQMDVDAVILEDFFADFEDFRQDKITFRDLCNVIDNSWIVNVAIKGEELRKVMMVPFNNITERKINAPVISGISFMKDSLQPDGDNISLAELKNEKLYTVAMPERIINGKRMGEVMTDYKIQGFSWQQILISDYLKNNSENIEAILNNMKPNIF